MIKFEILATRKANIRDGCILRYIVDDYAFFYEKRSSFNDFSLAVNTIELSLDDDFFLNGVIGYDPYMAWNHIHTSTPPFKEGGVRAIIDFDYVPGGVYRINNQKVWPEYVNVKTGWVCIGNFRSLSTAIEFANGCVAVLEKDEIVALWLKPESLPARIQKLGGK